MAKTKLYKELKWLSGEQSTGLMGSLVLCGSTVIIIMHITVVCRAPVWDPNLRKLVIVQTHSRQDNLCPEEFAIQMHSKDKGCQRGSAVHRRGTGLKRLNDWPTAIEWARGKSSLSKIICPQQSLGTVVWGGEFPQDAVYLSLFWRNT